ncbi:MAG TPA: hypothetical protein VK742_08780 [Candidatus Sulfotelmatobacter sp.]|jgi:hypothetical protein|nr:hypothetical protein [Candidatus Sulfotelmatobacter sp.]
MTPAATRPPTELSTLLRGEVMTMSGWSAAWNTRRFFTHVAIIVFGAGFYGAAMGWWRAPQQALFVGIKFPLIILMTTFGNALINGMLAPLLGLNIPFRQSFSAVVMSFAVTSAILGAFAPLTAFMVWCAPPMSGQVTDFNYAGFKLVHVAIIMFAGVTGNTRLLQLLVHLADDRAAAVRVLVAWLGGNLFLGSQLSWILRPFIGSPQLPVEFLRENALHGNFYEDVLHSLMQIF